MQWGPSFWAGLETKGRQERGRKRTSCVGGEGLRPPGPPRALITCSASTSGEKFSIRVSGVIAG